MPKSKHRRKPGAKHVKRPGAHRKPLPLEPGTQYLTDEEVAALVYNELGGVPEDALLELEGLLASNRDDEDRESPRNRRISEIVETHEISDSAFDELMDHPGRRGKIDTEAGRKALADLRAEDERITSQQQEG